MAAKFTSTATADHSNYQKDYNITCNTEIEKLKTRAPEGTFVMLGVFRAYYCPFGVGENFMSPNMSQ